MDSNSERCSIPQGESSMFKIDSVIGYQPGVHVLCILTDTRVSIRIDIIPKKTVKTVRTMLDERNINC